MFFAGFSKGHQAANYIFWLSELQPTIAETNDNKDIGPSEGCMTYKLSNVQFSYPLAPDSRVMKGVSMTVSTPDVL
jgi:ATP-binding cassette subfamily B (MDR/TAP) protein 1